MAATGVKPINHWISGSPYAGSSGRSGAVYNPATGEQSGEVDFASVEEIDATVQAAKAAFPAWRALSLGAAGRDHVRDPRARARTPRGDREAADGRARQGAVGRDGRGHARARGHRVLLRHPASSEGRHERAGVDGRRRVLDAPAARCRRGHHAVQLPGDGPDVDVGAGDRVRQHVRPQAVREGSVGVDVHGGAPQGGRRPGRRLQRRARRQGRGRRDPRASRYRSRLVRRLDADRALRLRDRDCGGQAVPGARRGEEPHDRASRRRHRHGGRRRGVCRIRLGGRAVHGGVDARRRRRRRRSADRRDQAAHPEREGRRRDGPVQRDGAARDARASRQGRLVPRRGRTCSSTAATAAPTTASSLRRR